MPTLRPVRTGDAAALAAIVDAEVRGGFAHFGTTPVTAEQLVFEIEGSGPHPWLVADDDGRVVGYARSGAHKTRGGYAWTAEVGVYLAPDHQGRGLGRRLVEALLAELKARGFRTIVAGIALPNPGSQALFESLGFQPGGTLHRVGYKRGAWRDVGYWTLHLGAGDPVAPPADPDAAPAVWVPIVQVDAFADRPFEGNPAAVMRLPAWLPDETLRALARENNLSETAFVVREPRGWHLRWFTPTVEVDLCGHATLAAGFVLLGDDGGDSVAFHTRSGVLTVARDGGRLAMELPSHPVGAPGLPDPIREALGATPAEGFAVKALHHADYWLARFDHAAAVAALTPDLAALRARRANVICTAPGSGGIDFVSRFFAPGSGVDEDPVTGSAHATLTPFWVDRLGRNPLVARQVSARGGTLGCELVGDRVVLRAGCVEVLRGTMRVR